MVMKTAFEQIPSSFEESAKLDGASAFTILAKILIPLVMPTTAVIVLFSEVQQGNAWFPVSIYLPTKRDLWLLQLIIREIVVQNEVKVVFADAATVKRDADLVRNLVKYSTVVIVTTLPILCVYPFV